MDQSAALQQIDHLQKRLTILSETVRAFAEATTDYERLLDVIARRVAHVVGDGCVVRLLEEDGWLAPIAVHMPVEQHIKDEQLVAELRTHMAARHNVAEQPPARQVLETGEPLLIPKLDLARLRGSASEAVARAYETVGIHSLLIVALRIRGQSIGILSMVRFSPESRPFGPADLDLAQALADHAALAITNARSLQTALNELAERERTEVALRRAEEQLRQSQKMEAIGRLSGSIAHDFNNLLSVILGHGALLLQDLKQQDPVREEIVSIVRAADRAADLTRQLLAFSRQQVLVPRVLDLNRVLRDAENMLGRLLGDGIEFVTIYSKNLAKVRVDATQVDQIVMNLAINARDAMPDGGKLTIETQNVVLDQTYASEHFEVTEGPYAMLAVSDTGLGMDRETQARIFEPFFTTKDKGKGTGLGLSTIFGIVKQSGGSIWVYSEPGKGTTFRIYFPKAGEVEDPPPPPLSFFSPEGNETILLTEDRDDVRKIAAEMLRRYGYHVLEARNAGEALLVCEQHPLPIQLLLTDVVMPKMGGRALAERLTALRPDLRVLYMSGYTDNAIVHHGMLDPGLAYVQKPLVPEQLARAVRAVLEQPLKPKPRS